MSEESKQLCKWCFNGEQVEGQDICQSCMDKLAEEFCGYLELKND